jgi:leucyl-tRNA synthetase
MSKSLGNIIPLREAIKENSADAIRLAILISAELLQDADFYFDVVKGISSKLQDIYNMGIDYSFRRSKEKSAGENGNNELFKSKIKSETKIEKKVDIAKEEKMELEDRWLISRLQHNIGETTSSMDSLRVREALHNILYLLDQDLQWYKKRINAKGRENSSAVRIILFKFLNARVRMLAPFAPFLSEEIWEKIREHDHELSPSSLSLSSTSNSIIFAEWPKVDEDKKDLIAEESEYLIMNLISDLQNIIKVAKIIPKKIIVYTSAQWKTKIYRKLLQDILLENRTKFGDIMKEVLNDPEIAVNAKKDPRFIRKMIEDILSEPIGIRNRRLKLASNFNEIYAIDDAASLLLESVNISRKKEKEGQEIIKNIKNQIILYSEDDLQKFDPASKAKLSRPFKPAIYMVSE